MKNYILSDILRVFFKYFLILHFTFIILHPSIANAIEVGGHLSEDTIWSPENNPYLVTSVLYVDNGATLYIEPGTQVYLNAARCNNDTYNQYFTFHGTTEPTAKMIWVNGRIVAEGTEQDNILFTRIQQDSIYYKWGVILISEEAELSSFKFCRIEYASHICINLMFQPWGAIAIRNSVLINNCKFADNLCGIEILDPFESTKLIVSECTFKLEEEIDPESYYQFEAILFIGYDDQYNRYWITDNDFHYLPFSLNNSFCAIDNRCYESGIIVDSDITPNYVYGNYFYNAGSPIQATAEAEDAGIYIKKNIIEADSSYNSNGIRLHDYGYFEVSDNIVDGRILGESFYQGKIENNYVYNHYSVGIAGTYDVVQNNIINNCGTGDFLLGGSDLYRNNLFINNQNICNTITDMAIHENNIYVRNENVFAHPPSIYGSPVFRNCILDFELPEGCIDGGNNIILNPQQVEELFVSIENNDFHLAEGSLAIDAGFDTTGYYPLFDLDYSNRVWDGDGNGISIIDIGPYEYGSEEFGRLNGYITETDSGEPVDYVLLRINDEPGNFEFADSVGYFEFRLPAGIYDLYAERVFYEDNIIYSITVEDGETTELDFNMTSTLPNVSVGDETIAPVLAGIIHLNYPNPFNPCTTIQFSTPEVTENSEISIYNIKGQRIRELKIENVKCKINSVVWDGRDSSGKQVSSGVFLYKISTKNETATGKVLMLK